jgi:hypothetical protein
MATFCLTLSANSKANCENKPVSPRKKKSVAKRARSGSERELTPPKNQDEIEEYGDGIYVVRKITGSTSNKPYRCPGCDQIIPMATPHTVAWLEHDAETRRHWHSICWSKRNKRAPKVERTRNAPRY